MTSALLPILRKNIVYIVMLILITIRLMYKEYKVTAFTGCDLSKKNVALLPFGSIYFSIYQHQNIVPCYRGWYKYACQRVIRYCMPVIYSRMCIIYYGRNRNGNGFNQHCTVLRSSSCLLSIGFVMLTSSQQSH